MWIAFAIAGGIIVCTFIGSLFDYLGKKAKSGGDRQLGETVKAMEARVASLENRLAPAILWTTRRDHSSGSRNAAAARSSVATKSSKSAHTR